MTALRTLHPGPASTAGMSRRLAAGLLLLPVLAVRADPTVVREDFENGGGAETLRRFADTSLVITAPPEQEPGAWPPPSGQSALQVMPDPNNSDVGGALVGPTVDRRDPGPPAVLFEACLHLLPSGGASENNFALIACDDSGATVAAERYYRFGFRAGVVYHQRFDGREFSQAVNDAALGASLQVPGWHTFTLRLEGAETLRCFVDGREAGFSPVRDGLIPRVRPGVLVWSGTGLPLLADDVGVITLSRSDTPREVFLDADSDDPLRGSFHAIAGPWQHSTGRSHAEGLSWGIGSWFVPGREAAAAVFAPLIPAPGLYEIFVTWSTSGNSTGVLYTVTHADGQSQLTLDQNGWGGSGDSNADRWISLGTHRLEAGTTNTILVASQVNSRAPVTQNAHRVYADAVRVVPRGSEAAAPPVPLPPAVGEGEIAWRDSLEAAQAESRAMERPLVIYARSAQSRSCREMEQTVLTEPAVVAALNAAVPVRLDLDRDPVAIRRFSIYRVPTVIVLHPDGTEAARRVGQLTATDLVGLVGAP